MDLTPVEKAAHDAYEGWGGLEERYESSSLALLMARRIRQRVCQTSLRSRYSKYVAGTDEDCMRGMCCAIIESIRDQVRAPKGGMASLMRIHPSRFKMVFELQRWPPHAMPVREYFSRAVWWILMGHDWKAWQSKLAKFSNDRARLHQQEDHPERDWLWVARTALDIVDFFFPKPGTGPQPYFLSERRNWDSSFDRNELLNAIKWTRRMYSQTDPDRQDERQGRIALFVSTQEAMKKLFSGTDEILRELSIAAIENPKQFAVHILHPSWLDRSIVDDYKAQMTKFASSELMLRCSRTRENRAVPDAEWINSIWSEEPATERPKGYKVLRTIVCFIFFGYSQPDEEGNEYRIDRLYILRPSKPDDHPSPFSIAVSDEEMEEFLNAARERYGGFSRSLMSYIGGNRRQLIERHPDSKPLTRTTPSTPPSTSHPLREEY